MIHTIDVTGKTIGRTASAAAKILMGKNRPTFERHLVTGEKVHLINVSKAKIDPRKLGTKEYERYSGYPGGFKKEKMSAVINRKGYKDLFIDAIHGMLPANKLRAKIMKNLTITE